MFRPEPITYTPKSVQTECLSHRIITCCRSRKQRYFVPVAGTRVRLELAMAEPNATHPFDHAESYPVPVGTCTSLVSSVPGC